MFIYFQKSLLYNLFESETRTGILLGDSGYACKNWLLPPFRENQIRGCQKRENYNREQKRARCIIERAFGQLKRRWGCLHGEIRFTPEKACKVIIAACALHNLAKDLNMPENEAQNANAVQPQPQNVHYNGNEETGMRQHIVDTYFNY